VVVAADMAAVQVVVAVAATAPAVEAVAVLVAAVTVAKTQKIASNKKGVNASFMPFFQTVSCG